MNATRHADHARRIAPFVHQSMSERGMRSLRSDLDPALLELDPAQLRQVHAAAEAVAKGADGHGQMDLLAALRTISLRAARAALSAHGILYRADVLLPLAAGDRTSAAFARDLSLLQRADVPPAQRADAGAALLALCGPLDHSDLLAPAKQAHQEVTPSAGELPALEEPQDLRDRELARDADRGDSESATPSSSGQPLRRKAKVFGKTSAMTWETAPLRGRSGAAATTTVMIEGAAAAPDSNGYDWDRKVVFACTLRELPQLLAVLMGWISEVEFGFHSGDPRKKLAIVHQAHGLFVKLQGPGGANHSVPVDDADRYALAMLVLHAMTTNDPMRDAQAVLAVCRDVMSAPRCLLDVEPESAASNSGASTAARSTAGKAR